MAEQQLKLIKTGAGRGGSRAGAGRKAKRFYGGDGAASSKTIRVPLLYVDAVKKLIAALDAATEADQASSETIKMNVSPDTAKLAELGGGVIELLISVKRLI